MHLRSKGVKRYDKRFHVGGEEIKVMEEDISTLGV